MKYFVLILSTIFITLSIALPNKESIKINKNTVEKGIEYNNFLTVDVNKHNEINILPYIDEEETDRMWGVIGNLPFMVYKNMDSYIYVDGIFYETKGKWLDEDFFVDLSTFESLFELEKVEEGFYKIDKQTQQNICKTNLTEKDIFKKMNDVHIPIEDAKITQMSGQLPGAKREYRSGFHEGFDWYSGSTGIEINRTTNVYPLFEGEIVRIDKDYIELNVEDRNQLLADEASLDQKKYQKNLDKLRGRQVWIQSKNGILVHYAHLDSVNDKLDVGDKVTLNQPIGKTGNSGTSNGALNTEEDIHLHTDIVVCGKNFWEYGEIEEMNEKIIDIFEKK